MYADTIGDSMRRAIDETERRRKLQIEYNEKHGITPATVRKAIRDVIEATKTVEELPEELPKDFKNLNAAERKKAIKKLEKEMKEAARDLEFEKAALLRDLIFELRKRKQKAEDNESGLYTYSRCA